MLNHKFEDGPREYDFDEKLKQLSNVLEQNEMFKDEILEKTKHNMELNSDIEVLEKTRKELLLKQQQQQQKKSKEHYQVTTPKSSSNEKSTPKKLNRVLAQFTPKSSKNHLNPFPAQLVHNDSKGNVCTFDGKVNSSLTGTGISVNFDKIHTTQKVPAHQFIKKKNVEDTKNSSNDKKLSKIMVPICSSFDDSEISDAEEFLSSTIKKTSSINAENSENGSIRKSSHKLIGKKRKLSSESFSEVSLQSPRKKQKTSKRIKKSRLNQTTKIR